MGLLSNVVLAPVKLVTWTADRIREAAEAEYYDEQAIATELARLNDHYDRGLVDDQDFAVAEDALMERLRHARGPRGSRR